MANGWSVESERSMKERLATASEDMKNGRHIRACTVLKDIIESEHSNVEAYVRLGEAFVKRGRHEQAIEQLKKALEISDKNEKIHHLLGQSYTALGRIDAALQELKLAIEIKPKLAQAYHDIGLIYARQGDHINAINYYTEASKHDPELPNLNFNISESMEAKAEYNNAFIYLKKAFSQTPADQKVHQLLVRILPYLEKPDEAIQEFQKTLEKSGLEVDRNTWARTLVQLDKTDEAIDYLLAIVANGTAADETLQLLADMNQHKREDLQKRVSELLDPIENPSLVLSWAKALAISGLTDSAAKEFERVATQLEVVADQLSLLSEENFVLFASFRGEENDDSRFDPMFDRIQKQIGASRNPKVLRDWAFALLESSQPKRSILQLERILELQPNFIEAYILWGDNLRLQDKFNEAVDKYLDATKVAVENQENAPWESLLSSINESKLSSQLKESVTKAAELYSEDATVLAGWGQVLAKVGSTEKAIERFKLALNIDPNCELVFKGLSQLMNYLDTNKELTEYFTNAAKKSESATVNLELGCVLAQLGEREAARQFFDKTIELNKDVFVEAAIRIGDIYGSRGDFEGAIDHFQRAIQLNPDYFIPNNQQSSFVIEKGHLARQNIYTKWMDILKQADTETGMIAKLSQLLVPFDLNGVDESKWDQLRTLRRNYETQLDILATTLEEKCDSSEILVHIGKNLNDQAYRKLANRLFQAALLISPISQEAQFWIGYTFEHLGQYLDALDAYEEVAKNNPKDFFCRWGRARTFWEMRRFEEANKEYDEALKLGTVISDKNRADLYDDWAFKLEDVNYAQAFEKNRLAIDFAPNDFWKHFRLAHILDVCGQYQDALQSYQDALALEAEDLDKTYAHHNIAHLWQTMGNYKTANQYWKITLQHYQKAMLQFIEKRNTDMLVYYAKIHQFVLRDLDIAEAFCRAALTLDPSCVTAHSSLINVYLERKKDTIEPEMRNDLHWKTWHSYDAAQSLLQNQLKKIETPKAWTDLGVIQSLIEEYEQSETSFKKALQIDRDFSIALQELGKLYLKMERHPEAIRFLEASIRRKRHDLDLRSSLAKAYLKSDKVGKAEQEYNRVLAITRLHVDSLVGIAEVYITKAESLEASGSSEECQELYKRGIESISKAIEISKSEAAPSRLGKMDVASMHYLRGYARTKLHNLSSGLFRDAGLLNQALSDFGKCEELDPFHYKAKQAKTQIQSLGRGLIKHPWIERFGSMGVMVLSLLLFLVAQILFFIGFPTKDEILKLSESSLVVLGSTGLPNEKMVSLKMLQDLPFRNMTELQIAVEALLNEKLTPELNQHLDLYASRTKAGVTFERIHMTPYLLLSFGALLFFIAGSYLPQLTHLRVAGIHLEKGIETPAMMTRTISISK